MKNILEKAGWPVLAIATLAGVIAVANTLFGDAEFFAAGILGGLSRAVLGILAVWVLLQAWDRSNGLNWKDSYTGIATEPMARAVYHAGRLIAVCLLFGLVIGCTSAPASASNLMDTRFDGAIKRAAKLYLPTGPGWPRYKAQLFQESRLEPDAISPVGARGIAQFMPGTWDDMIRDLNLAAAADPHDARLAIDAGAYYRGRLERGWNGPVKRGERALIDRHRLAEASYNAGMGNILKAQKLCGGAASYVAIATCLPDVTGRHHAETWTYVRRIERWTRALRKAGNW